MSALLSILSYDFLQNIAAREVRRVKRVRQAGYLVIIIAHTRLKMGFLPKTTRRAQQDKKK